MMYFTILDNSALYQQSVEYEQYSYSYDEPQTQNYDEGQNVSYTYGITPYQDYEHQQQSEAPVNYNYDQMNYGTTYQSYDQQSTMNQDYTTTYQSYDQQSNNNQDYAATYQSYDQQPTTNQGHAEQPIAMQNYDHQSTELSGYSTAQYDQSQGYSYDNHDTYTSSYVPSASGQNYASQTGPESYSGWIKYMKTFSQFLESELRNPHGRFKKV